MCTGAAMESKIALIVFGLRAPADSGTGRVKPPESPGTQAPEIVGGILAHESRRLFERFVRGKEGSEEARYAEQLLALTTPT
jgi:tRNA(Arg) A34 adenosine deaminase TadA